MGAPRVAELGVGFPAELLPPAECESVCGGAVATVSILAAQEGDTNGASAVTRHRLFAVVDRTQ
jgi:hypothetical protein